MTKDEIQKAVESSKGNQVRFAVVDMDGVLRGKSISKVKFMKSIDQNIGFCNVIFGWDMNDQVYDHSDVTGWHTGFPDSVATIDLSTYRTIPWNDNIPFFIADFHQSDDLSGVCPRTLLKNIEVRCRDMGYSPFFASEYEWYNFQETPQSLREKDTKDPEPLTPGMFGYSMLRSTQNKEYFNALVEQLHQFGIPVEGMHTETGDGVYEACIEYTSVVEAADKSALFKTGTKEISHQHGIMASFMAKWSHSLPGCGGHIHQSLWDDKGKKNLFFENRGDRKISSLLEHYLAGQLHCLPEIMPMFAPNVNSYKRFVSGSWASTSVSWGIDNRTTALRVVPAGAEGSRLETRVPGADANPYLAMAAALASGLYGIKNKLTLDTPQTRGNEYENKKSKGLPRSLKEAVDRMKSSSIPAELFGESFIQHFLYSREWEWEQFSKEITDWELKRYFEII